MLDHGVAIQFGSLLKEGSGEVYLGYLPLAHILEIGAEIFYYSTGNAVCYADPKSLLGGPERSYPHGGLDEFKPTLILRCKVAIVGDAHVGKTALTQMFHSGGQTFQKQYAMTVGVDFCVKVVNIPETDAAVIKQRSEASFRRMIERREDTLEAVAEAERRAIEVEEAAAAAVGEAEEELSLRPRSNSATPPGGNSPAPAPGPKHGRRAVGRRPAPAAAAEPASSSSPPPSVRDSTRAKAGKALAEWAFEEKWQWDWQQTLDAELSPGAAPLRASTVAETRTYRDRRIARRLARESIDAEAEDGSEKKSEIETETESASASAPPPAAEAPPSSTGAIVFDDDDVSEEELPPETSTAAAAAAAAAAEKDAEDDDDDAADIPTELSDSDGDGNDDDLFTKIIRSGGTPDKRPRRPWPEHRTSPLPLRVVDVDAIREVESLPAV